MSKSAIAALRAATGAGILDCKNALAACGGAEPAAIDWLKKKGLAKAASRAKETKEGLVITSIDKVGRAAAIIELGTESDFAARTPVFLQGAEKVAARVLALPAGVHASDAVRAALGDSLLSLSAAVGETITPRRAAVLRVPATVPACVLRAYAHNRPPEAGPLMAGLRATIAAVSWAPLDPAVAAKAKGKKGPPPAAAGGDAAAAAEMVGEKLAGEVATAATAFHGTENEAWEAMPLAFTPTRSVVSYVDWVRTQIALQRVEYTTFVCGQSAAPIVVKEFAAEK